MPGHQSSSMKITCRGLNAAGHFTHLCWTTEVKEHDALMCNTQVYSVQVRGKCGRFTHLHIELRKRSGYNLRAKIISGRVSPSANSRHAICQSRVTCLLLRISYRSTSGSSQQFSQPSGLKQYVNVIIWHSPPMWPSGLVFKEIYQV